MSRPIPIQGNHTPPHLPKGSANPFVFLQINVVDADRAEAFFRSVFQWHFIDGPISAVPDCANGSPAGPPEALPKDQPVYFTPSRADKTIVGGLFRLRRELNGASPEAGAAAAKPHVLNYIAVECIDDEEGGKVVREKWAVESNLIELALFSDTEGNVFGLLHDKHIKS